jgi:hypothetical protein
MEEATRGAWFAALVEALDHDAWGQVEEAAALYGRLLVAASAVRARAPAIAAGGMRRWARPACPAAAPRPRTPLAALRLHGAPAPPRRRPARPPARPPRAGRRSLRKTCSDCRRAAAPRSATWRACCG